MITADRFIFYAVIVLLARCRNTKDQSLTYHVESLNLDKRSVSLKSILKAGDSISTFNDSVPTIRPFNQVASKPCTKCQLDAALIIKKRLYNLSYSEINDFLCSIGKICENNVEFSEISNEVIFKLLTVQPVAFLDVLSRDRSLEVDTILKIISNPLLDYNLDEIYKSIEKIETNDITLKNKVLRAISNAFK
jgi:hypothetical protein